MGIIIGVDEIIETKVACWVNNQVGINVRHWRCNTNPGSITPEELCELAESELVPLYTAYLATTSIVDFVSAQIVGPVASDFVTRLIGTAGGASATTMPRQACGIVTLLTGLYGRANRGRFFVPFPTEEMNETTGSPNGAGIAAMEALGTFYTSQWNLTVDIRTGSLLPVLVHRGETPDPPTDLTGFIVRDKWGTQKRRGDYGQLNARLS